jgi:CMP-N,N'-diacetyllegionaminic acid synthase
MKRLCTICARGGSKGVKNKNIRPLLGKPLIVYSIEQARNSGLFQYIAVSSDSKEILETAKKSGADYLIRRPAEMASDTAPKLSAIRHCFLEVEKRTGKLFDVLVDLDATSPLRNHGDIVECVKILENLNVSNVLTGSPARRSPYFNLVEEAENGVVKLSKSLEKPVFRRQDTPKCYDMNASIYVWQRESLLSENNTVFFQDTQLYVMPENRSIDIDTELDFQIVEFLKQLNMDEDDT